MDSSLLGLVAFLIAKTGVRERQHTNTLPINPLCWEDKLYFIHWATVTTRRASFDVSCEGAQRVVLAVSFSRLTVHSDVDSEVWSY